MFVSVWKCNRLLYVDFISCSFAEFIGSFQQFFWLIYSIFSEKAMAPHSSTLAWKTPWTEEPGRLQSMRLLRDTTERLHFHFWLSCIGEGNGNPLQCSCLENPRDRGAWWAAVYGVTQSWTQLKWLSSSIAFSIYKITSSANTISLLPFWSGCLLFVLTNALATVFSIRMNNSGESGHHCPVPDLCGTAFNFLPLSIMLAVSLSYMAFIKLCWF